MSYLEPLEIQRDSIDTNINFGPLELVDITIDPSSYLNCKKHLVWARNLMEESESHISPRDTFRESK